MRNRILSLLVLVALIASFLPTAAYSEGKIYKNSFTGKISDILNDNMLAFHKGDSFYIENERLKISGKDWALFSANRLLGANPYECSIVLQAKEVNSAATCGAAITLRGKKASTFMDEGITFLIRNKTLRVMEKSNEISLINLPFTFENKARQVWLEDKLNEILFYAQDDNGQKTLICSLKIDYANLTLTNKLNDKTLKRANPGIKDKGYLTFMSHFTESSLDYFSFTFETITYEPTDMEGFRDTYYDTWVASDNLDRSLAISYDNTSKNDKAVGLFYFLWHNMTGPLYDHNKAYQEGGAEALWKMIPQGARGYGHYWAEPYFGYYRSDDEWIIRKHTSMLVNAGVDFIFFDMSNGHTYFENYSKVMDIWHDMRKSGAMTPQFVCFLGDRVDLGAQSAIEIWNDTYMDGIYRDLWFEWEGKPLLLGNLENVSDSIKENFTLRRSWAFTSWDWYTESDGKGKWPWIDLYPQKPGKSFAGVIEQMIVSCGFHANSSLGRSFSKGIQPSDGLGAFEFELETTPLGLAFEEQFERALKVDPSIIMITGWNEWWAGRWDNEGVGQMIANTYTITKDHPTYMHNYVDCFNPEFSRDIEPMKGGFGDNYYYQMVNYIRRFKGTRPVPQASKALTINIKSGLSQWDKVSPEFRDNIGDITHRNHPGNAANLHYLNTSGRNDIDYCKVARDDNNFYFLVTTIDPITEADGENWMNLFIDIDQNHKSGWEGYDFVINRSRDGSKLSIEKNVGNQWEWEKIGEVDFVLDGNMMQIKIPHKLLETNIKSSFDFKWADNSTTSGQVMEFMDQGDSAPDDRFNFRYNTVAYKKPFNFIPLVLGIIGVGLLAGIGLVIRKKVVIVEYLHQLREKFRKN